MDKLVELLSKRQKDILTLIQAKDVDTLLKKYEWSIIYPTLKTFEVLGLVDFKNKNIDYPKQLQAEFE